MNIDRIKSNEVLVLYADLGDRFGYYRSRPGCEPYLCLNKKLLTSSKKIHFLVYQTLLAYHRSVPENSAYRLFPFIRFFHEIIPSEKGIAHLPELEFIGRAKRVWAWPVYSPTQYRILGKLLNHP